MQNDTKIFLIIKPNKILVKPNIENITIISIVNTDDLSNYELAYQTTKCYSLVYGYDFITVNINYYKNILSKCNQTDFMFKRHCFLSYYLKEIIPYSKYVLFIDADIGVINPTHNLTKYLPIKDEEILFEERIFNYEISAGSYFVKNDVYARDLLLKWANFEKFIPNAFSGSDNVALHPFLFKYLPPKYKNHSVVCQNLWETSQTYNDLERYVACLRYFMKNYFIETKNLNDEEYYLDNGKIKIIKKLSKRKWVRDVWLTESKFSDNDFMLHGLKKSAINSNAFASWTQIIYLNNYNISKCKSETFYENWVYNWNFMTTNVEIKMLLKNVIGNIDKKFHNIIKDLNIKII
uniref:Nucleotid_trans domain-containing protein n=1 Tax=Strongyloides papillosus TaxID=174720 RepID=A0A0N5CA20_STREA